MADLDAHQKIALINENLQEVLKPEIIENAIVKENRPLVIYWGKLHSATVIDPTD
jgi:tyrosyl-tRNA synthetase